MKFLVLFLVAFSSLSAELIDLEENPHPFVLETKQIHVPGFPDAFNPSIVRYQGKILMSFRDIPNPKDSFVSNIGLVWLDDQFNPIGYPQILTTRKPNIKAPTRAEDGRLILIGERLFLAYSDNEDPIMTKAGCRMFLGELRYDGSEFHLEMMEKLSEFEGADPAVRERNWTPFVYEGCLLLAYSILPHKIFLPFFGRGFCKTVAETEAALKWPWGVLRGGTSALQGVAENGEYLTFFHSSIKLPSVQSEGKNMLHYFMGVYTFSAAPPFEITRISKEPILAKKFYSGEVHKHYWHPLRCVFPTGYIFDEHKIYLAYGRQDHEIWIASLDREGLMQSLIPVKTK